jgi:hypothetical protein
VDEEPAEESEPLQSEQVPAGIPTAQPSGEDAEEHPPAA